MAETTLTVRQIMDLGLWEQVCEYKGWNKWILNEGQIQEDELVTFDSEFKKEGEVKKIIKWKDVLNCEKLFPKVMWECKDIACELGFKYILFNGLIYYSGQDGDYICTEDELVI